MKKLLILLFSLFFLYSPSVFADSISDFEIEGISIGESLLDYMTEDEILKEIERTKDRYHWLKEPYKYAELYLFNNIQKYDSLSFFVINNPKSEYITNKNDENEKYTILSIYGMIDFTKNFDSCIVKRDEIAMEFSKMFPNADKRQTTFKHTADPSGKSIVDAVYFDFDSGDGIEVSCSDYEETYRIENNWSELLNVAIKSEEVRSWMRNY
ncbi:hypothetical protein N9554_02035 [Candidatus Thioglobus sp.]|nr:hypothetical protein [Candidatus Thioglobus sp.]